jgi:anti-anti-sigma factor
MRIPEGRKVATTVYNAHSLKIDLEETSDEAIVYCHGRINAETAESFQNEVRDYTIPASRGSGIAMTGRIVLDMSNVTHIDNAGLEALLKVWTAGQQKSCSVEIVNRRSSAGRLPIMRGFDRLLKTMRKALGWV